MEDLTTAWDKIAHTYCVANPEFEPDRCKAVAELFAELGADPAKISYISPTYKHTISQAEHDKHIRDHLVLYLRMFPMRMAELSLILNYKAVLEDIERNHTDGLFFIFESDVIKGESIARLGEFVEFVYPKRGEFDLIHIGIDEPSIFKTPVITSITGYRINNNYDPGLMEYVKRERNANNSTYIEDITNINSPFRLIRKFYTKCTDSYIWTYAGAMKLLDFMRHGETNFGLPLDYYIHNFCERNVDNFKFYWSVDEFFKQGSNAGLVASNIK